MREREHSHRQTDPQIRVRTAHPALCDITSTSILNLDRSDRIQPSTKDEPATRTMCVCTTLCRGHAQMRLPDACSHQSRSGEDEPLRAQRGALCAQRGRSSAWTARRPPERRLPKDSDFHSSLESWTPQFPPPAPATHRCQAGCCGGSPGAWHRPMIPRERCRPQRP